MKEDSVVQEVRKAREAYAARFNFDLRAMGEELQRLTEQARRAGRRVVLHPARPAKGRTASKKVVG
jgi:hypothetical protein